MTGRLQKRVDREADPLPVYGEGSVDYSVRLCRLTDDFMRDYPLSRYPELLNSPGNTFIYLCLDISRQYSICIPFRSDIRHGDAYVFRKSRRAGHTRSGLDYTKIVLARNGRYLKREGVSVDRDEYREALKKLPGILDEVQRYVDGYIGHVTGIAPLHAREFERRYRYSTLPYFHDIMGI